FFFFQAEDGIRDFHVTGVQTCALPICVALRWAEDGQRRAMTYRELMGLTNRIARVLVEDMGLVPGNRVLLRGPNNVMMAASWLRSEERRVGKECRSRWSPCHCE